MMPSYLLRQRIKQIRVNNLASYIVNKHYDIFRALLVLIVVLLLIYLYPRNKFKYEFEQGEIWQYETLYSPVDFSIIKSSEELELEQEEARNMISPYYDYDAKIGNQAINEFKEDFKVRYNELINDSSKLMLWDSITIANFDSSRYQKIAVGIMDSIYKRGIIKLDEEHQTAESDFTINLKKTQLAILQPLDNFFNEMKAYQFIVDELRKYPEIKDDFLIRLMELKVWNNIIYNKELTEDLRKDQVARILPTRGFVQKGEALIYQGTVVTPEKYQLLVSLREAFTQNDSQAYSSLLRTIGYFLITSLILGVFSILLMTYQPKEYKSLRRLSFIFMLILIFQYSCSFLLSNISTTNTDILYVIPFSIVPVIIRTFFGNRLALYTILINVIIATFVLPVGTDYVFLQIITGLVAIMVNVKAYYWSQFFISTAYVFLAYCIGYLGVFLVREGSFDALTLAPFGMFVVNAFLVLFSYILIPIFEKIFGFVSNITLVELSDLNKPLLKALSIQTPGTFWHSVQVANLAEAAAYELKADTLLVRVGALYHDIGKMENPKYFIENQKSAFNPHDDLPYVESANIIINHVIKGIEMAKKNGLPNDVIDFIRTHHGTTRTEYFYRKEVKEKGVEEVDPKIFSYPGPTPYSKETAIVMIADSLEAASRSLKDPTQEDIDNLVDNIVKHKIDLKQFDNCDLSFQDIKKIKKIFKKLLKSNYHVRVKYPGLN